MRIVLVALSGSCYFAYIMSSGSSSWLHRCLRALEVIPYFWYGFCVLMCFTMLTAPIDYVLDTRRGVVRRIMNVAACYLLGPPATIFFLHRLYDIHYGDLTGLTTLGWGIYAVGFALTILVMRMKDFRKWDGNPFCSSMA